VKKGKEIIIKGVFERFWEIMGKGDYYLREFTENKLFLFE